jgi:hypothetical protein
MLDLLYVAKLDFLASLRRSPNPPSDPGDRFVPIDIRQETADLRRGKRKAYGKAAQPGPGRP